ncbi:MAG: hypothetical protein HWN81_15915 [Candidatus Lokiarchaeota archaeon]|nr:hypothetical protein [Candidatus Lokiarchaeota archaeon]
MGKGSGKAIAIIALCISLGFGGYIVYDKIIVSPGDTTPITPASNQYFKAYYVSSYVLIAHYWLTVQALLIEFNITQGESVYFFYLGQVILTYTTSDTYMDFYFMIDGIRMHNPTCKVEGYNNVDPDGLIVSASLIHYNSTLSPGSHNVTITYRGSDPQNYINPQSLFVQTFK